MSRLNRLYAELSYFEYYLNYLHDALNRYTMRKQPHWTEGFRRKQIEDIRISIFQTHEDITEIKQDISCEKAKRNQGYKKDNSSDNYEYEYDDYTEYDEYSEYDEYDNYQEYPEYLENEDYDSD